MTRPDDKFPIIPPESDPAYGEEPPPLSDVDRWRHEDEVDRIIEDEHRQNERRKEAAARPEGPWKLLAFRDIPSDKGPNGRELLPCPVDARADQFVVTQDDRQTPPPATFTGGAEGLRIARLFCDAANLAHAAFHSKAPTAACPRCGILYGVGSTAMPTAGALCSFCRTAEPYILRSAYERGRIGHTFATADELKVPGYDAEYRRGYEETQRQLREEAEKKKDGPHDR